MQYSKFADGLWFTSEQVATIVTFTERNLGGLRVEIVTGEAEVIEIAEFWQHDRSLPLFLLTPLPGGAVKVYDVVRKTYESDTIGAALVRLQTYHNGRGSGLYGKMALGG